MIQNMFDELIVIEGSDGSGKATQAQLLLERIRNSEVSKMILDENRFARILDFPDYNSKTGELITHMLMGGYGNDAKNLNPYFTSPMYGLDRFQYLQKLYSDCNHISIGICNRYTDSNLIHQGARIKNNDGLISYWAWLCDFEYNRLKLPFPDHTIFLYVPAYVSLENIRRRSKEDNREMDINETEEYLTIVDRHISRISSMTDWHIINCYDESAGKMRPIEDIHNEIVRYLKENSDCLRFL